MSLQNKMTFKDKKPFFIFSPKHYRVIGAFGWAFGWATIIIGLSAVHWVWGGLQMLLGIMIIIQSLDPLLLEGEE